MKLPRYFRLLPSVVVVGGVLLAAKTTGLVNKAYAEAEQKVAALAQAPNSPHEDFAGGEEDQVASASEVDVLGSLTRRRKELDAREQQLTLQANMIAAAESRVDGKIAQLKSLQTQIAALLNQRDEAQKAQVAALVKTYTAMKPADAARIFNSLPDDVLVPVAQTMKSDVLGGVLSKMNADAAQKLTVKLANKLTLPMTADAVAPAPAPVAAPAPGQQASAAPAAPAAAAPTAPENKDKPKT